MRGSSWRTEPAAQLRRLGVTSSPVVPSPRVAPRTSTPSTYSRLTARPSTLGSTTNGPGSRPARSRARSYQARSSSSEKALARLSIGTRWRTGAKLCRPSARPAQAVLGGPRSDLGSGVQTQLGPDVVGVGVRRALADDQLLGNTRA